MLYDHRTYTCTPGTLKKQMALYEKHGWAIQKRHLGEPLLYGPVETGNVNSYVHIWVFKDAADRSQRAPPCRATLNGPPISRKVPRRVI